MSRDSFDTASRSGRTASRSGFATKHARVWIGLAWFGTLAVLLVSHVPQGMGEAMDTGVSDKVSHAAAYGVLAWCWLMAFGRGDGLPKRRMLCVIFVLIAIGTVAELTQPLVGRVCDLMDWVANVAGVSVVVIVWMIRMWRRRVVAE